MAGEGVVKKERVEEYEKLFETGLSYMKCVRLSCPATSLDSPHPWAALASLRRPAGPTDVPRSFPAQARGV